MLIFPSPYEDAGLESRLSEDGQSKLLTAATSVPQKVLAEYSPSAASTALERMAPACDVHCEKTAFTLHSTVMESHSKPATQSQQIIQRSCQSWAFASLSPLSGRLCPIFA